jgi:hypothetical protein
MFLAGFLLVQSMRVWVQPKYPSKVDGETFAGSSKSLQHLDIDRRSSSPQASAQVAEMNLFRKERREYTALVQVAQVTPSVQKTPIPPPELKLKGVILLEGTKIALLEGSYSFLEVNNQVKSKPIKRKGYSLGSKVGTYHLTNIEKNLVELDNPQGKKLLLKLADRAADKIIQRQGNSLMQSNKSFNPKELTAAPPSRRPPPTLVTKKVTAKTITKTNTAIGQKRSYRVSGSSTNIHNTHISGK